MVTVKSDKVLLGARVSKELYEKVRALTGGENAPFQSISDYLTYVVSGDLAKREALGIKYTDEDALQFFVKRVLEKPDMKQYLRDLVAYK